MQVLTDSRCIQKFSPNYQIDQYTQLCAGETNQMRDTCQVCLKIFNISKK